MKPEDFLNLLSEIDEKYIINATPKQQKNSSSLIKCLGLVACFCFIATGILSSIHFINTYKTATAYISIDVNPSLELCLNQYNRVIDVTSYNEEGKNIITPLKLKNKTYSEALNSILNDATFSSYLNNNDDLTIGIASNKHEFLHSEIENCLDASNLEYNIYLDELETHKHAKQNDCSVGKYLAYTELSSYDDKITIEQCKDMSMHEIYESIDHHHSQHHNLSNGNSTEDTSYTDFNHNRHHSEHH